MLCVERVLLGSVGDEVGDPDGLPVDVGSGSVVEVVSVGSVGSVVSLVGLTVGLALLNWIINTLAQETVPQMGLEVMLSTRSLIAAGLVGLLAVALAPVLTLRRLVRMDIPSTLRVVE